MAPVSATAERKEERPWLLAHFSTHTASPHFSPFGESLFGGEPQASVVDSVEIWLGPTLAQRALCIQ